MKKITLICFGKLKTPGLSDAVGEFSKRLTRYTDFQTIELKASVVPEKSAHLRSQIPENEGELLQELLASPGFKSKSGRHAQLWCLDETGTALPTKQWASEFSQLTDRGSGELVFIIGGGLGLGTNILQHAQKKISLGPQTLSHELARLILVEQLYRSLSLLKGHPYHNEG